MTGSMEAPFLLSMLRRRRRALILGLLLGVLVAVLLESGQERYRAEAQLLIGGPASGNADANSLERNLSSQLSVIGSRATARAVAEDLGSATSTQDIVASTSITEVPGSDVVQIEATANSPELAEAIADGYINVYLETSAERSESQIAPEIERLDARLTEIDGQVTATNAELAAAVAPYLRSTTGIPDPRTVAPEAAARQQLLLNEYDRILQQRQDLQQQQLLRSRSTVLQEAVADDQPIGPDRRRQVVIVVGVGVFFLATALAIDGLSGRTISDREVEEALDTRVAARFPARKRWGRSSLAVADPEQEAAADERLLWLKAERLCPSDGMALVLVTGAAQASGSTTVAMSLALQFAAAGRETVLMDAVGGAGSISDVWSSRLSAHATGRSRPSDDQFASMSDPGISRLSVIVHGSPGRPTSGAALRDAVTTSVQADVLVIDTMPGLGAAMALHREAHVVVVAVDANRSKVKALEELGVVLSGVRDRMLPVLTHPLRPSGSWKRRGGVRGADRRQGRNVAPGAGGDQDGTTVREVARRV